jgi:anti-sigma factor RsiW
MVNLNDEDRQLIERHLDGLLTTTEQLEFAQKCQSDEVFAAQVRAYEQAVSAVKVGNRAQLKAQLTQHVQKKKVKRMKLLRGWFVGLSAAASLVIGWFVFGHNAPKTYSYEEAFQVAFQPAHSGGIEKGAPTQTSLLDSAYQAYDNQNWQVAIALFDRLDAPKPKTLFLKANAYLAIGQPEKATPILNDLKKNPQLAERQEDIDWYLALCALRKGDTEGVQKLVAMPNHLYYARAQKLLEQIKR